MSQPTVRWDEWPRVVTLRHPGGQINIDLFLGPDGARRPAFGYAKYPSPSDGIADVIWLELSGAFRQGLEVLSANYVVHQVDPDANCSGDLTAYGHPETANPWPRLPSDTSVGPSTERSGLLLLADMHTEIGFSGGPVLNQEERLAGMLIGSDDAGQAQIVAIDTLHNLISGRLTGSD